MRYLPLTMLLASCAKQGSIDAQVELESVACSAPHQGVETEITSLHLPVGSYDNLAFFVRRTQGEPYGDLRRLDSELSDDNNGNDGNISSADWRVGYNSMEAAVNAEFGTLFGEGFYDDGVARMWREDYPERVLVGFHLGDDECWNYIGMFDTSGNLLDLDSYQIVPRDQMGRDLYERFGFESTTSITEH